MTAKDMANKKYPNGAILWVYRIKDNPYPRNHISHTKWYNEFYDECRRIGRRI